MGANDLKGASRRDPKHSFSQALIDARNRQDKRQEDVAKLIGVSPQQVGHYESGQTVPDPVKAVKLAKCLGQDPAEWVLRANVQKASCAEDCDAGTLKVLQDLVKRHSGAELEVQREPMLGYVSLSDFPYQFEPLAVIVGDKREEHPYNTGDLFAFSASTVDDRWIARLCLPAETEKYSDKVFAHGVAKDEWLRERFGTKHLLALGSPASNLFTRRYNKHFLFRFAISRETEQRWHQITMQEYPNLRTPADLRRFAETWQNNLRQMMRMFKQPGFVDFNYRHLKLGIDPRDDQDFAVISIGRNPFAAKDAKYYSILVAGVHHPGTAQALKFLSDPTNFRDHPFGGVLEIEVPSRQLNPLEVEWYEKIEKSDCFWHEVSGDSLIYTPESLKEKLRKVKDELGAIQHYLDFILEGGEVDEHLELVELLAPSEKRGKGGEKAIAAGEENLAECAGNGTASMDKQ